MRSIEVFRMWQTSHRGVLKPLCSGVALRLFIMLFGYLLSGTAVMSQGDTPTYLAPGHNLLAFGSYTSNHQPEIDRTPGYPLFAELTGMYWDNILTTLVAQLFVSAASMLLIFRIARTIFGDERAASLAVWLYAIEPLSALYVSRIMPETLFVFLILLVVDRLLSYLAGAGVQTIALTGLLLAAATFVRPVSYYLIFPTAIVTFFCKKGFRTRIQAVSVFVVCALSPLAAWQLRNSIETGYQGYSSIVEKNLYFFQSAEISAQLHGITLEDEQRILGYGSDEDYLNVHTDQRSWTRARRLKYMHLESVRILRSNTLLYLESHLRGMTIVAASPGVTELLQIFAIHPSGIPGPVRLIDKGILETAKLTIEKHPVEMLAISGVVLSILVVYALALMGLFAPGSDKSRLLVLAGFAAYFIAIAGGAQAVARYRIPAIPMLSILAAGGWCSLFHRISTLASRPFSNSPSVPD